MYNKCDSLTPRQKIILHKLVRRENQLDKKKNSYVLECSKIFLLFRGNTNYKM